MEVKEIGEADIIPEGFSVCFGIYHYDTYHFRRGHNIFTIDVPHTDDLPIMTQHSDLRNT